MAKRRLSNDAIRYIVECRNDSSNVYTWQEIADLVKDKFFLLKTPKKSEFDVIEFLDKCLNDLNYKKVGDKNA